MRVCILFAHAEGRRNRTSGRKRKTDGIMPTHKRVEWFWTEISGYRCCNSMEVRIKWTPTANWRKAVLKYNYALEIYATCWLPNVCYQKNTKYIFNGNVVLVSSCHSLRGWNMAKCYDVWMFGWCLLLFLAVLCCLFVWGVVCVIRLLYGHLILLVLANTIIHTNTHPPLHILIWCQKKIFREDCGKSPSIRQSNMPPTHKAALEIRFCSTQFNNRLRQISTFLIRHWNIVVRINNA